MRKKMTIIALMTSAAMPVAFDTGKPGWKMDGDKIAVDADGNPIYLNAQGQETSIKGETISNLNAEARTHRTAKETAEAELAKYKVNGKLIDPETAIKAIDTVSKIDAKTLIDAGEVDRVKDAIKGEFTTLLTEKDKAIETANETINNMRIDRVFDSEFMENVAMPKDFFTAAMRSNFKVEDGKVIAYDRAGNPLMSKKNLGERADPNEALELLVEMHPQKDTILKAPAANGTGNGGGGGGRGGSRTVKRADFDAMSPGDQAATAAAMGKGEMQIVD